MSSLLDAVKGMVTNQVVGAVSSKLGESELAVEKGVGGLASTILSGIAGQSGNADNFGKIFNMLNSEAVAGFADNPADLIGQGNVAQGDPKDLAGQLVGGLFGDKVGPLLGSLGSVAGFRNAGSSSSLLGMVGPMVMSMVAKKVLGGGLGVGQLMDVFKNEQSALNAAVPGPIAGLLGIDQSSGVSAAALGAAGATGAAVTGAAGSVADTVGDVAGGAADLAGGAVGAVGDGVGAVAGAVGDVAGGAADLAGDAVGAVGDGVGKVGGAALGAAGALGAAAVGAAGAAARTAGGAADAVGDGVAGAGSAVAETASGGLGWLRWLLPLLLIAAAVFWWINNRSGTPDIGGAVSGAAGAVTDAAGDVADAAGDAAGAVVDTAGDAAGAVVDTAGDVAGGVTDAADAAGDAVGSLFTRKVGDFEISGNPDGAEAKLIDFIESDREICKTKDCWFTMDRLTFETGSSNIDMAKSSEQLNNIKSIMTAYPTLGLKLGGYTDNTGALATNMRISQQRADAVKAWLVGEGFDASRIGAEGYGPDNPISTNDTAEGRAQNRRIDVRVDNR